MLRRTFLDAIGTLLVLPKPRPTVTIDVHQSTDFRDEYGSGTLMTIAHHVDTWMQHALDANVQVHAHTPIDVPSSAVYSAVDAYEWWDTERPDEADVELLVCADERVWTDHGGYATVGGPTAVMQYRDALDDSYNGNLALHEIGHCLTAEHVDADTFENTASVMYGGSEKDRLNFFTEENRLRMESFIND